MYEPPSQSFGVLGTKDEGIFLPPFQMSTSVPHSHPARMEASVCMTGVASTTVCACQASMDAAVSARLDLVSRQGKCWALGKLDRNLVLRKEAGLPVEWGTEIRPTQGCLRIKAPVTVCPSYFFSANGVLVEEGGVGGQAPRTPSAFVQKQTRSLKS